MGSDEVSVHMQPDRTPAPPPSPAESQGERESLRDGGQEGPSEKSALINSRQLAAWAWSKTNRHHLSEGLMTHDGFHESIKFSLSRWPLVGGYGK